ncbi:MAG: aminotransferase class I/II-fold pyridoxal phosphate-dependent enzyme, partial [Candidatus Altiarchaeota archaeon]|nr:aminotransferase class I/II-fold pyridoxal phosphate-dependent enzyme [Candidatus Altiarchaeota archaeon]
GKIKTDREILFRKLSERFRVYKSEANFILMDVSPMKATEFFKKMLGEGFIVRNFGGFHGFVGEYVRVSVGTTRETEGFINALESIQR